ncbi:MAG: glycoside hydrolase family 78 protein [Spirochaetaceae bacterium]|jgi:alpha-L-rhamnosidase|nr:glycoside hydrolase family 78 protein [Spirochaetaceae bacterium]
MIFDTIPFIKAPVPFIREYDRERSPCVLFRRDGDLKKSGKAVMYLCGLGYAYCYINGEVWSADLFTAPVSDYRKTLWYTVHDVTDLIREGRNSFAVLCGNGFYNESLPSSWNFDQAPWRDNPKFIMRLDIDGRTVLSSGDPWKCTDKTPVLYNELRSGEHFDARLYRSDFATAPVDESFMDALADDTPPGGVFREHTCEPVRECGVYPAIKRFQTGPKRFVFDVGQNISGYIRLKVRQKPGDRLTIRYAESLKEDHSLELFTMNRHYPASPFMTDEFICNGEEFTWSPRFTYHGFRYIEIEGLDTGELDQVSGVFVHQDIPAASSFECSDPVLTDLFRIGRMASWSNFFYMPTDCPTREKLGWTNDAQASAEQMLINFSAVGFFTKWYTDILDAQAEDGSLPGVIPTGGWGYEWGNGPVSDGILFEIPARLYQYTGDPALLLRGRGAFRKYLDYLETRKDPRGMVNFGFADWTSPAKNKIPLELVNTVYVTKFLRIAETAASLAGDAAEIIHYKREIEKTLGIFRRFYLTGSGLSVIDEISAIAMTIAGEMYAGGARESIPPGQFPPELVPLKGQLQKAIEGNNFHHNCGMAGMPHLFQALEICGLTEYGVKILRSNGFPSYRSWLDQGATTLWEEWKIPEDSSISLNHHMYSCFMAWILKSLLGIRMAGGTRAWEKVEIAPSYECLDSCKGHVDTPKGRISLSWERLENTARIRAEIPPGVDALFFGKPLKPGLNLMERPIPL